MGHGAGLTSRLRILASTAVLLLMALLLGQGEAVRLHAIEHGRPVPALRNQAVHVSAPRRDGDHDEATCPLCREDTFFGHYVTPDAPELTAVSQYRDMAASGLQVSPFRATQITRSRIRGPPVLS